MVRPRTGGGLARSRDDDIDGIAERPEHRTTGKTTSFEVFAELAGAAWHRVRGRRD